MKKLFISLIIFPLLFISTIANAWESHFLITYAALKNMPIISSQPQVRAESLSNFIAAEKNGLAQLLEENEQWAETHVINYPPLPKTLVFKYKGQSAEELKTQFLESIRVNPTLSYPLYIQSLQKTSCKKNELLAHTEIMLPILTSQPSIRITGCIKKIVPGERVSALSIITTAADEPDYGLDVNLWENNNTWFGKIYQLGEQPFGNPILSYGSQAPFHMGFYHEPWLLYKMAGFLEKCYPEYRIHLFSNLSKYAFKTGHPYWGYRFLGWTLHYIQDLTQPYHAKATPGINLPQALAINFIDIIGFHSFKQEALQLLSNRHFSLENYTSNLLRAEILSEKNPSILLDSLADSGQDLAYAAYDDNYPRTIIAKESSTEAGPLDTIIRETFPHKYVEENSYIFYTTEPDINLLSIVEKLPSEKTMELNQHLGKILKNARAHTRNMVRYVLAAP